MTEHDFGRILSTFYQLVNILTQYIMMSGDMISFVKSNTQNVFREEHLCFKLWGVIVIWNVYMVIELKICIQVYNHAYIFMIASSLWCVYIISLWLCLHLYDCVYIFMIVWLYLQLYDCDHVDLLMIVYICSFVYIVNVFYRF